MNNVFHPSFGSRPERFVGRDDVISRFLKGLKREPGHRDRATLILGQRGMGKTALLLQLAEEAKKEGFVSARVTSGEDMLEEIIETIQITGSEFVDPKRNKVRGFSTGAFGFSFGLTFSEEVRDNYGFRTKLSLLCDKLAENDRKVLLLIDEVQANSDVMRTLTSTYQHLAGEKKDIAIVMAGLPGAVSNVLNDKVLTFLNRARKEYLGPLAPGDVMTYYADALAREKRNISTDKLKQAAQATEGFPYLLQLIGYYIIEFTAPGDDVTDEVLEKAIATANMELEADVFAPSLNSLSRRDLEILRAIAAIGDTNVSVQEVIKNLGISNSYFQQYRARLIKAGVLDTPRDGEVEISVPYLGRYLRERANAQLEYDKRM